MCSLLRRFAHVFTVLALTLVSIALAGCKEFLAAMPKVVSVVQDAMLILDQIEGFTGQYFQAHPSPDKERAVADALRRSRHALIAAQRAGTGADKLDKGTTLSALADFQAAYSELLKACEGIPGLSVGAMGDAAPPGGLTVPEPVAMGTLVLEE